MAEFEFRLEAAPVLSASETHPRIRERSDLAIVSVATPLGGEAALESALRQGWGLPVPDHRTSALNGETRAIRTSPDQFLLVFPHPTPDAEPHVQAKLAGAGYTTDQSDAWVVFDVEDDGVHLALERLAPIDLSDTAFPINAAARTVMEHMGALVVRMDQVRFLIFSARSSALSFYHALERSFRYTRR